MDVKKSNEMVDKIDKVLKLKEQLRRLEEYVGGRPKTVKFCTFVRPMKEYERIFMCNTEKDIWKTLLITHQGNSQVKDNKIDLLVQQYEQFVISKDESIDSSFARFNTIITGLKAIDEGYSSKNYVRKFLRALHLKWIAKVTAIKESKDLTSLSLDELIENLKVHEMIINKDYEIVKAKGERKSLSLKAKKESNDEESLTSESEDEKYAMVVRDFTKFFKGRGRCGDLNHLIGECLKPPRDKSQRAFVGGFWSDSGEEDDERLKTKRVLWLKHLVRTKKTEFEKSQNETPSVGGPLIARNNPLSAQATPKVNQGPLSDPWEMKNLPIRRIHQGRYSVSVPALTKDHRGIKLNTPYPEYQYAVLEIWNEYNILENIKHGPYSKKSPIRRIQFLDTPYQTDFQTL
ncbi:hypothetical protein Tco_0972939 [Tanacetum coccineum]